MMKNMTDLDRALCGCGKDMELLEYIYNETYVKVCSVCYSVLSDKTLTEDAAQETYIRLTEVYGKYKSGTNPLAFILKIAVNVAKEHKRAQSRHTSVDGGEEYGDSGACESRMISDLYTDRLLARLNEKQRIVVMLYVYVGLTFEEIAKVTGSHANTVRYRYGKAVEILKNEVLNNEENR